MSEREGEQPPAAAPQPGDIVSGLLFVGESPDLLADYETLIQAPEGSLGKETIPADLVPPLERLLSALVVAVSSPQGQRFFPSLDQTISRRLTSLRELSGQTQSVDRSEP